ncbi:hypothetical protein ACVTMO_17885 [Pseudomonas segetis]
MAVSSRIDFDTQQNKSTPQKSPQSFDFSKYFNDGTQFADKLGKTPVHGGHLNHRLQQKQARLSLEEFT